MNKLIQKVFSAITRFLKALTFVMIVVSYIYSIVQLFWFGNYLNFICSASFMLVSIYLNEKV